MKTCPLTPGSCGEDKLFLKYEHIYSRTPIWRHPPLSTHGSLWTETPYYMNTRNPMVDRQPRYPPFVEDFGDTNVPISIKQRPKHHSVTVHSLSGLTVLCR